VRWSQSEAAGGRKEGTDSPGHHGAQPAQGFDERPSHELEQGIQATRHFPTLPLNCSFNRARDTLRAAAEFSRAA